MARTIDPRVMLRYVPVYILRRRSAFIFLCFFSLLSFWIFQKSLGTDRVKIRNSVYTGNDPKVERRELMENENHTQLRSKEISRDNMDKREKLVLYREKLIRSKRSKGKLFHMRQKESHVDKNGNQKDHPPVDINGTKKNNSYGEFNADLGRDKELMDKLYKLLLTMTKEDNTNDLVEETKPHEMDEFEVFPFDPLKYPQSLNAKKLLKTFAKHGDLPNNPVNEWKYTAIINPTSRCRESESDVFLLFIVKTKPDNFNNRNTIRETWADEERFPNIRTVFSIGIPRSSTTMREIKQEALEYKDVLMMDYMDTYHNLTLKTTSGINWAVAYCDVAKFVVSVDDDMYVATDFLFQHLKHMPRAKAERLFHGHLYHGSKPIRRGNKDDWQSKWSITKEEYPFSTYPDYIFGGFVIMSMRTVVEMSLVIPYTKPIDMEDVFLGIVASRLGIVATNTDLVDVRATYSIMEKFKTLIASHNYSNTRVLKAAWECHLSIVEEDVEKSKFCIDIREILKEIQYRVNEIQHLINVLGKAG